ncbi:hypothetical protein [Halopiger goleimassiliensis]|uniref:hypothetical protein n=1 Tax=Halopiger goleimassiliensis TaxID=1293048 RepID=UPI000677E4A7|nr:hypothetical protein [Halopiger goleimassiliensis]
MGPHDGGGLSDNPLYRPSFSGGRPVPVDDDSSTPFGVKLCCVVAVVCWLDHVTFLSRLVTDGDPTALAPFGAFGVAFAGIIYGLWTRREWGWAGGMVWFALVGAFSVATLAYGRAIVCFLVLAYLNDVNEAFQLPDRYRNRH